MSELKRTQLYEIHLAAGATMVDFGGWDMPVQYPTGIVAEKELDIFTRTLRYAKDCGGVGRVAAVMLTGAWLTQFGGIGRWLCRLRVRRMASRLLAVHSSATLNAAVTTLMREMQVADFFALTAFLAGVNITKPTKAETTASGQR